MRRPTRRGSFVPCLLTGTFLLYAACSRDYAGELEMAMPGDTSSQFPIDIVSPDTFFADTAPMTVEVDPPARSPAVGRGTDGGLTHGNADTVRVVHGSAAIDLGKGRTAHAAHLRVVLEGVGHRQETLVGGDGEFFFEAVPVGTYRLTALPLQESRTVATAEVVVAHGNVVRIPALRIPAEAMAGGARANR